MGPSVLREWIEAICEIGKFALGKCKQLWESLLHRSPYHDFRHVVVFVPVDVSDIHYGAPWQSRVSVAHFLRKPSARLRYDLQAPYHHIERLPIFKKAFERKGFRPLLGKADIVADVE